MRWTNLNGEINKPQLSTGPEAHNIISPSILESIATTTPHLSLSPHRVVRVKQAKLHSLCNAMAEHKTKYDRQLRSLLLHSLSTRYLHFLVSIFISIQFVLP